MTSETEILHPAKSLKIHGETVVVRELKWKDALEFLNQLGGFLGALIDNKGTLRVNISAFADLIKSTSSLSAMLVCKSAAKDEAWLDTLSLGQMLELLDTALALNLSEEIIAKGKKIAGRFQNFAGGTLRTAPPASPKPMSSSSPTGTAATS